MADIVNLRRTRKAKERADKKGAAAVSRAAFGRTKADKAATTAEQARADAELDGKRRRRPDRREDPE